MSWFIENVYWILPALGAVGFLIAVVYFTVTTPISENEARIAIGIAVDAGGPVLREAWETEESVSAMFWTRWNNVSEATFTLEKRGNNPCNQSVLLIIEIEHYRGKIELVGLGGQVVCVRRLSLFGTTMKLIVPNPDARLELLLVQMARAIKENEKLLPV